MAVEPQNMLLSDVQYDFEVTTSGAWRRFLYPDGSLFAEYKSRATFMGLPLVHFTRGVCPETGRRIVAKGVIAVGRVAIGGIAVGQASAGIIAIGQASFGLLLGIGQLTGGIVAAGQAAFGAAIGIGQIATGYYAFGQIAIGVEVLGQLERVVTSSPR